MEMKQNIINQIRKDFELRLDISDNEIITNTKNTLTHSIYEISFAKQKHKTAILNELCKYKILRYYLNGFKNGN